MYSKNRMKIMIGAFTGLGVILLVTLIYAAFTRQLNISGTSVNRKSKFDIHFEELSTITTTGTAKALTQPRIASPTSIEDYSVSETSPGDTISFTFKVVNDGNYNASISSLSVGTPECSGTDSTSNSNVCSKLTYTLTYENGSSVQTGDILNAKDNVTMKMTLTYQEFNNASLLPTEDVSISNLGITINYQQSGNALVKENGEVADYRIYKQGEKIALNNENYYVIANSGTDKDYVVALKENPLTVAEVNLYGGVGTENNHVNKGGDGIAYDNYGYGGMAYYSSDECINRTYNGCINNYDDSDIKYAVDAWSYDKFVNNELKEVDGYTARLIKTIEYSEIASSYDWKYNSLYWYWTMTEREFVNLHSYVYGINTNGDISNRDLFYANVYYNRDVVRPVINVYKSALETNNNQ